MRVATPLDYERIWWGDCANTFHEEQKQLVYAPRMGLLGTSQCGHPPTFNLGGRSVLDIGGGPSSLLLKAVNFDECFVIDPCPFPSWVRARYTAHGITLRTLRAEDYVPLRDFDEVWIYNVLQHVDDPALIVRNARKWAARVRIFEWIDVPADHLHPNTLTQDLLDEWLGAPGFTANIDDGGAQGRAYYSVVW
jgi:hypothetical protein